MSVFNDLQSWRAWKPRRVWGEQLVLHGRNAFHQLKLEQERKLCEGDCLVDKRIKGCLEIINHLQPTESISMMMGSIYHALR